GPHGTVVDVQSDEGERPMPDPAVLTDVGPLHEAHVGVGRVPRLRTGGRVRTGARSVDDRVADVTVEVGDRDRLRSSGREYTRGHHVDDLRERRHGEAEVGRMEPAGYRLRTGRCVLRAGDGGREQAEAGKGPNVPAERVRNWPRVIPFAAARSQKCVWPA